MLRVVYVKNSLFWTYKQPIYKLDFNVLQCSFQSLFQSMNSDCFYYLFSIFFFNSNSNL